METYCYKQLKIKSNGSKAIMQLSRATESTKCIFKCIFVGQLHHVIYVLHQVLPEMKWSAAAILDLAQIYQWDKISIFYDDDTGGYTLNLDTHLYDYEYRQLSRLKISI